MLYELRIYHMHPGRLPAIHKRFKDVTLTLFKKHGIRVCDFYEVVDHETICYICAFSDHQARDDAFKSFVADPEWQAAYAQSHADGGPIVDKIESIFMTRVPYIEPDWP